MDQSAYLQHVSWCTLVTRIAELIMLMRYFPEWMDWARCGTMRIEHKLIRRICYHPVSLTGHLRQEDFRVWGAASDANSASGTCIPYPA